MLLQHGRSWEGARWEWGKPGRLSSDSFIPPEKYLESEKLGQNMSQKTEEKFVNFKGITLLYCRWK